tara:strand:+ start:1071 stop:1205 length:135 start_codon:yes stop_codon:yes gene_type:complete
MSDKEFDENEMKHFEGKAIMGVITFGLIIISGFGYLALNSLGMI